MGASDPRRVPSVEKTALTDRMAAAATTRMSIP